MTTYHVANWGATFENTRSRRVEYLRWVPIPNSHDGEKYTRLISRKDGATIFAAWILIVQVASKCQPRGSLVRSDGSPLDADSLAVKTRAPAAWFEAALPYLKQIGWMSSEVVEQSNLALDCPTSDPEVTPKGQEGVSLVDKNGRNGMEGKKEGIGRVAKAPAPTVAELVASLKTEPAYQGIDVAREVEKCRLWCQEKRKNFSRMRAVNWLMRVEAPIAPQSRSSAPSAADPYKEPKVWRPQAIALYPDSDFADRVKDGLAWSEVSLDVRRALVNSH